MKITKRQLQCVVNPTVGSFQSQQRSCISNIPHKINHGLMYVSVYLLLQVNYYYITSRATIFEFPREMTKAILTPSFSCWSFCSTVLSSSRQGHCLPDTCTRLLFTPLECNLENITSMNTVSNGKNVTFTHQLGYMVTSGQFLKHSYFFKIIFQQFLMQHCLVTVCW